MRAEVPAGIWYCTRESVKTALSEAETARTNAQVDAAIEQGARDAEGLCHREVDGFAPLLATRYTDYPSRDGRSPSYRARFGRGHYLLSATSVTVDNGATTLAPADYILRPDDGPPYTSLEVSLGGSASLGSSTTWQRAIAITGLWGAENRRKQIGSLSGSLAGTTNATASLAWTTARFGTGDVLFIDSEAMTITDRSYVDSGVNLGGSGLTADDADTTVSVADGTAFAVEEIISISGERMRIVEITGNTLSVVRAWDGSQLAAHTVGADIYALTGIELERAVLGTTIAAHSSSAAVYQWQVPGPLATLNRAYAINVLVQERSAWARAIQVASDTAQEVTGRGIRKLEDDVIRLYGRRARHGAIT